MKRRSIARALMLALFFLPLFMACNPGAKRPPEDWNDRRIFSYDESDGGHYGCTLVDDDVAYPATFEDFMNCRIFEFDPDVTWTAMGDEAWLLVTRTDVNRHEFVLKKSVTPMGVEGVDIVSWTMNGTRLAGLQKTGNLNRMLDSREWRDYQDAERGLE